MQSHDMADVAQDLRQPTEAAHVLLHRQHAFQHSATPSVSLLLYLLGMFEIIAVICAHRAFGDFLQSLSSGLSVSRNLFPTDSEE